jgi:pimeloyl-ACP methyl ester carboxylesterase
VKSRRVTFPSRAGHKLAGILDLPEEGAPTAAALFAHCFTCGKNLKSIVHIDSELTARGIGVLRFDFTGIGESGGDFSTTHLTSNREDLLDAAAFLAQELMPPALLVGHSLGGAAVLLAAHELPSVAAVAVIAAPSEPGHLNETLERKRREAHARGQTELTLAGRTFLLRPGFFADLEAHEGRAAVADLGRALLILHSPQDDTVDIKHAAALFRAARHPKSFVSLADAGHLLLDERDGRYAGAIIAAWAQRYL